ncbi:hypothetical protein [Brevibacillus fulvus]|uniref:HNH nuclease domain-containing protein n=1 Tax=Brevibacillus fulvus TaxID=1125967 RepID=A0A938XVF8_9BACL|nr:hypothetical protein [Brevibacillus fulvus]MBM7591203.1 hypothetical protein [Brevibacillus fulvus]
MKNYYEIRQAENSVMIQLNTREGVVPAFIDYDDLDKLQDICTLGLSNGKARSGKASGQKYLHLVIVGEIPKGNRLEWINGNQLDCRKSNLQLVDKEGNVTRFVKIPETPHHVEVDLTVTGDKPKSTVPGVTFHKASQLWNARPYYQGQHHSLGYHKDQAVAEQKALDFWKSKGVNIDGH